MASKAAVRAAASFAAASRQRTKEAANNAPSSASSREPQIDIPNLSQKLSEVRSQLNVLVDLFDNLTREHDERIKSAVARTFSTKRISTQHRMTGMTSSPYTPCSGSEQNTVEEEDNGPKPPKALLEGTIDDVRNCIEEGDLHPNTWYENFRCMGKDFEGGTPLAIAVLRGNKEIVGTLVESKADLESDYAFIAGAEQLKWSGPASHASVPGGSLDVLKELVKLGADIKATGSNGANLVWQAAYFNQPAILEYLIDRGVEHDTPATSQDNSSLQHTPLHAAAIAGHGQAVAVLLNARASPTMEFVGRQPLEDAIRQCHGDIVKQLMVARSDIFAPLYSWSKKNIFAPKSERHSICFQLRCIDMVFDSANPVLLSHVAQGLKQVSTESMSKADFIRFLSAPGDAPVQILDAIFHRCPLRYWDEVNGKRFRARRTAAFIKTEFHSNICEGPNYRIVVNAFNRKTLLPGYASDFMEKLLPQEEGGPKRMYVPVNCFMCHIPMVHKDLKALLAIEDCKNPLIFGQPGCQAIINLAWRVERPLARLRTFLALVEVLALFAINLSLTSEYYSGGTQTANVVSLFVWAVALFIEAAQMVGYASRGITNRYWQKRRYWFDFLVLILTGSINIALIVMGEAGLADAPLFRTAFGILCFLKWMRFLTLLRQFKRIGINILPITTTMWDIIPFGIVLGVYLIGSVNLYYALGINSSLFESCMLVYRLVVLGDMNLAELDNVMSPQMKLVYNQKEQIQYIEQRTIVNDQYYVAVRLFIIFVSFVMGLTMMNLFVAILCLSYSEAAEGALNSYMRSRTGIVLDQRAVRLGLKFIFCRRKPQVNYEYTSTTLSDEAVESRSAYVWLARQGA